jgi:membrane associated rhomboid family serine protease
MHTVDAIENAPTMVNGSLFQVTWPCPNVTSNDANCTLGQLCGFGADVGYMGRPGQNVPNQWFRFIIPMFMHAGLIHIGFNMLLQMTLGRDMEIDIGPVRFFIVYIASGIFGFVLGGNFAADGISSTGASGALFGIIALTLLDLLYTWSERVSPWKDLGFIAVDVVISFVLGLLPGLDNFSHIGGFLMGIVLGICILNSPAALRRRIHEDGPPYAPVKHSNGDSPNSGFTGFIKSPVGFFKGRKPAWWAWWIARGLSLAAVFIIFILLLQNFYTYRKTCSWCKYLSCIVSTLQLYESIDTDMPTEY